MRRTIRKRLTAKLSEVKEELRRRTHESIRRVGEWLKSVLVGHYNYYGVPMNRQALWCFRGTIVKLWRQAIKRKSHKSNSTWERMKRLAARFLPHVRVCHPYPLQRLGVIT